MSFIIAGNAEVSSMALSTVINVPTSNTPIMRCLSFSIPKSIDPPCGRVAAARRTARSRCPGVSGVARVSPPSLRWVRCAANTIDICQLCRVAKLIDKYQPTSQNSRKVKDLAAAEIRQNGRKARR